MLQALQREQRRRACLRWQMTPPNNHRSFYAHDLWNIKYLHKFKWHHLTEKIAADNRTRQDRMRAEIAQAKKESTFYLKRAVAHRRFAFRKLVVGTVLFALSVPSTPQRHEIAFRGGMQA